ncbi:hypothetical protein DICVIV_11786 [Dictyocaulus viviparus]|uniref:K Homology domain-containing protein n=1 Tax=Dictyocaulus viviparus TaxID=29172 RepID=A0A0D8XEY2_DICVI|nr:hypothetical protein DICVIV_11786 [Dictyocaulus viviparus]
MCAILHLNNVNLPGGELRRKGLEVNMKLVIYICEIFLIIKDEVAMSEHLVVGDMVSAEVQQVRMRGQVYLHTRNLKYGKLGQGIMIKVFPSLVKPQKEYMHEMFGIGVIIGCNGMIWISSTLSSEANGGYSEDLTLVLPIEKRESMVRLAACIRMLAKSLICIYDVSILSAYSASINYQVKDLAHINVISLLIPKIVEIIAAEEKRRMEEKDREELARKRRFL